MIKPKVKLTYISSQKRVRCEFTKEMCDQSPLPPDDIVERTKTKLKGEQLGGQIAFFRVFKSRLYAIWKVLRESDEAADTRVGVTIGSGAPLMPGLVISPGRAPDELGRISILATKDEAVFWKPYFLKLTIGKMLRDLGEMRPPNPAQVTRLWFRAVSGSPVDDLPLVPIPELASGQSGSRPYELFEEEQARDITLVVYDVHALADPETWEGLKSEIWGIIDDRSLNKMGSYHFLYDDLIRSLRSAERGPEHFGIDMPIVLLAAIDNKYYQAAAKYLNAGDGEHSPSHQELGRSMAAGRKRIQTVRSGELAGAERLQPKILPSLEVSVSPNKMEAIIAGVGGRANTAPLNVVNLSSWIESQLARFNFAAQASTEPMRKIKDILDDHSGSSHIIGMEVARGRTAVPWRGPFLRLANDQGSSWLEHQGRVRGGLRDLQSKWFAHEGDLVAEIAYEQPGEDGFDVFGQTISAARDLSLEVDLGQGIVEKSPGKFYAAYDGQPQIEGRSISIRRGLVVPGDVNLVSGNIVFDGPVEITGSVEAGARVQVSGLLRVMGSISGANVTCRDDLYVEGGILGGKANQIKVGGNITARFLENAYVQTHGNVAITDAITSSMVSCGHSISATNVVASELYLEGDLVCENLGKAGARANKIFLGTSKVTLVRIQHGNLRYSRFHDALGEAVKQRDVFARKTEAQLLPKHHERMEQLEIRVRRLTKLIDRVQISLANLKNRQIVNEQGRVLVSGVLAAGTQVSIGKHKIIVDDEVAQVRICYYPSRGMVIEPMEEPDESGTS